MNKKSNNVYYAFRFPNCFWAVWSAGPVQKKIWVDCEQLLSVFPCFQGQKSAEFFSKYCSVCNKKFHKIKLKNLKN